MNSNILLRRKKIAIRKEEKPSDKFNPDVEKKHEIEQKEMMKMFEEYEIVFIDDGSFDKSKFIIQNMIEKDPRVKLISFFRNFGKSAALSEGFKYASGDIIITMDADLQDDPNEIPALISKLNEGFDLVSGWKKKRYDPWTKTFPSKIFNFVTRILTGVKIHDFNCGLKAYKKAVVKNIDVRGEMHRYIPVLANNAGFTKIGEKVVQHQARKYGLTKFGMDRFINGFLDLITLWFLSKFGKRPMHLFGLLGTLVFLIGFGLAFYLGIDKLLINPLGRLITQRPEFYIALTTMGIGTQFFLAGFLGEMILRSKSDQSRYHISEKINL